MRHAVIGSYFGLEIRDGKIFRGTVECIYKTLYLVAMDGDKAVKILDEFTPFWDDEHLGFPKPVWAEKESPGYDCLPKV